MCTRSPALLLDPNNGKLIGNAYAAGSMFVWIEESSADEQMAGAVGAAFRSFAGGRVCMLRLVCMQQGLDLLAHLHIPECMSLTVSGTSCVPVHCRVHGNFIGTKLPLWRLISVKAAWHSTAPWHLTVLVCHRMQCS